MKTLMLLITVLCGFTINAQTQIDINIINNPSVIGPLEAPFACRELIEICKKDSLKIAKIFNSEFHDRTPYTRFCKDYLQNVLCDSLFSIKNDSNIQYVNRILNQIKYPKVIKMPTINWGRIFSTCETCSFCTDREDIPFYYFFVLVYMQEEQVKQLITFDNGNPWNDMITEIKFGNVIIENRADNACLEISRRKMQFLIDKWSSCQIPEIQELVKSIEENMQLYELINPVDVIKGTWRGSFGNKTINLTLDYDASMAETEKAEAKRTHRGWSANDNYGVLAKSIFDGQPENKAVSAKGYYSDGDRHVRVSLIEQPDTAQWNGEFNLWVNRKTNKMHGTWESNNKKLKREFELEKVKE